MARKGPLRRIIGYVGSPMDGAAYLVTRELLECGHAQSSVKDVFGETQAFRRRCRGCATDKPVPAALAALAEQAKALPAGEFIRSADPFGTGYKLVN